MVDRLLIVLDGAADPPRPGVPTTLDRARTPALDQLCREGAVGAVRTTPEGLPPGSDTGIPTLLGCPPARRLGRGAVEAAAAGVEVGEGQRAWRIDVRDGRGRRASASAVRDTLRKRMPEHRVEALRGHRLLAVGREAPPVTPIGDLWLDVWPDGAIPEPVLGGDTVVIAARGAALGCARLLGARAEVPFGATGDTDTDLRAKASAALEARDTTLCCVHVGAADEAAHRLDHEAKRAALERIDAQLIAPLALAARRAGTRIAVTADHSTSPITGRHGAEPMPVVLAGGGVALAGPEVLSEHLVPHLPVAESVWQPTAEAVA